MPVRQTTTTRQGRRVPAFTAGLGKTYAYDPDNPQSKAAAKQRAQRQNRARHARQRRQGQR